MIHRKATLSKNHIYIGMDLKEAENAAARPDGVCPISRGVGRTK